MKNHKNNQKGVSLLLTLLIMAAVLSIAFGLSKLSLGEIKISRDVGRSLIAYYAAEAGVECQMYDDRIGGLDCSHVCLEPGICYDVEVSGETPNRTIESNGSYQDITRAVELTY